MLPENIFSIPRILFFAFRKMTKKDSTSSCSKNKGFMILYVSSELFSFCPVDDSLTMDVNLPDLRSFQNSVFLHIDHLQKVKAFPLVIRRKTIVKTKFLFYQRKPGPLGQVRVQRLCHLNSPLLFQSMSCPHNPALSR